MKRSMRNFLYVTALVTGLGFAGYLARGSALLAPASGTWAPAAGVMALARSGAAAALLPDGRVLITGGASAGVAQADAELFNADGTFSAAAPMLAARAKHAAVTLQDGRVLVLGGTGADGNATSAAELYDPSANAWSSAGSIGAAVSGLTATLLQDGRVLVAGGENGGTPSAAVAIYDPVSGNFSAAGALSSPRMNHAAALLDDGRVLISGGSDGTNALATSDLYDPAAGAVTAGPALRFARQGSTATALDDGTVLVAGGSDADGDLNSAEIFDPTVGTFALAPSSLAAPRTGHLAFLLPHNNSVLMVGGTSSGAPATTAELYLSWTGGFVPTGSPSAARAGAAGSALSQDGMLVVAGGNDGTSDLASSEVYGFATVKTDAADYAPGSVVTITGSGWQPGETVTLTFLESPLIDTPSQLQAVADPYGNFSNSQFSPDLYDVGVKFYLTAAGSISQAQATFTDSVNSVTINSITPSTTITSLPASVTANFTYTTGSTGTTSGELDLVGTSVSATKALATGSGITDSITMTIPVGTPNGTYNVKVVVTNTAGTGANQKNDVKNGAVVINVPSDTTPPTINCTVPDQSVWYGSDVTVNCTASDSGSGLANASDASLSLTTSVSAGTETASAQTSSHQVCDNDGNCATAGPYTFKVDKKAPTISCTIPDQSIWYGHDVTVSCTADDGGSGLTNPSDANFTLSTSVSAGTETSSASTGSRMVTDAVGNSATAGPYTFKVDKKAPTVSCTVPDQTIWYAADVTVPCTAADSGSGLANAADASFSLTTNVTAGTETASASTGSKTVADAVGNSATAGPYTFKVDKKPPDIQISSPSAPGNYLLNQVVTATYNCTDGGSGTASCSGPVLSGNAIDTSSVGQHTFTVSATDNVGNSTSKSVTYNVQFNVCVLYDQSKIWKSGSTIPIKVQLVDANGVNYSSSSIVVSAIGLAFTGTIPNVEAEDSGNANPDDNFRLADGMYIFNLSTKGLIDQGTSWKLFFMATGDPVQHSVMFLIRC